MITGDDYFNGRDVAYGADMTSDIRLLSEITVARANALLNRFGEQRRVNSGWRPPAINAATTGAAVNSKHMTGQAIDLADPEGDLDEWCLAHLEILEAIGLWQEHPASTKGWCHVQIVPPKSGNRVFYP